MKKNIFWGVLLVCVLMILPLAAQKEDAGGQNRDGKTVTRTYELRHVTARMIRPIINPYIYQIGSNDGSSIIVVTLSEKNVKAFEDLLGKLDRPRRNINFRIFTVIASNRADAKPTDLHPDLQGVVDELKKVLGYRSYRLDGVSTFMVMNGSDQNELELNSQVDDLYLKLYNVKISGAENSNEMTINLGLVLQEQFGNVIVPEGQKTVNRQLIRVDSLQLKEGGYLVAGVSKLGENNDALVLVINAAVQ